MKKSIIFLAIISAFTFASCKKDSPAPLQVSKVSQTSSTSTVRILIDATVSTSDGKLDGDFQLITDTVLNTIHCQKHFNTVFGSPHYVFDTTIVVNSQTLNIATLLLTEKQSGSIFDIDYASDTYMTVWVDGVKKIYLKNAVIAENINLK